MKATHSLALGETLKAHGIDRAALNRAEILELAREVALEIARGHVLGEVTADDVYLALQDAGEPTELLGPAAGAIFRGKEWVWTGQWVPSTRVSNHARLNRVWRLRNGR